jgi:hypothetical protein
MCRMEISAEEELRRARERQIMDEGRYGIFRFSSIRADWNPNLDPAF